MSVSLRNPMAVAALCCALTKEMRAAGFTVDVSNDFQAYVACKQTARDKRPSPMFDIAVNDFSADRAFWMCAKDKSGKICALQAFRNDQVETSLADWCVPYMIGLYMRRQEMLVPGNTEPAHGSVATKLKGALVYHGELWVDKDFRPRSLTDTFSRIGLLLSLIKWRPDAVWALTSHSMATHGYSGRLGYSIIERGFLRWQWLSEGMEEVEYLGVATRDSLENFVDQLERDALGEVEKQVAIPRFNEELKLARDRLGSSGGEGGGDLLDQNSYAGKTVHISAIGEDQALVATPL